MRLLDRYVLRELLVPFSYCLSGFLVFYIAFDLIFQINTFQEAHLLFGDVVEYYLVTLPELLVVQVIPVSLLLASLYALTNHGRYNELTAMRAAGISLGRLTLPYFGVGLICGVAIFAINEWWVPQVGDRSKEIMQRRTNPEKHRDWTAKLDFQNEADRRHWIIGRYNRVTSEMLQPVVTWESPDGSVHEIFAQRGVYTNGEWSFFDYEKWEKLAGEPFFKQTSNSVISISLPETPAWIRSEIKVRQLNPELASKGLNPSDAVKSPQLSISEIRRYLRLHPKSDKRPTLLTQMQTRLAEPFTCLAVILIALPFGARSGRQNVFVGVASSIFICFGYFILQRVTFGMGVGGYLPPVWAAWLPNIVFGTAGLILLTRVQ